MNIALKNLTEGIPKIAVPIVSRKAEDILTDARRIADSSADIAEWRVDFFEHIWEIDCVIDLAQKLKGELGNKTLLFTCRTEDEGGEAACTQEEYLDLLNGIACCGRIDLLDAELAKSGDRLDQLLKKAHKNDVGVVLSYHNFRKTPEDEVLFAKFDAMQCGDVLKIAVMPNGDADVDRMIRVSRVVSAKYNKPVIAIVMGEKGRCTRIACESIGSALTFGTIGSASAPGQLSADLLCKMLERVHENIDLFRAAENSSMLYELIEKYCGI